MEVISTTANLGAMSPKEQIVSQNPMKKSVSILDSREDGVPELYAASDSGSMDSFEAGRVSNEEADANSVSALRDTPVPAYTRAKSAENITFHKSVVNNDLGFSKELDQEGQKELLMFLQAPSSVILQSILEYQPTASFGFVKTHVHDGLSDDENPEYDADDMTQVIFPSKTAKIAVQAAAATAISRSVKAEEMDPQRAAMPAAVRHFTPDPALQKEKVYEKQEAPIAVRHFTPDWETELPPTVRESLEKMAPEERQRWTSRPIAVQHFTPMSEEIEKKEIEFKPYEMPVAMKHFAPKPKEKKEYVPEPMPAAMRHFTPDWEAEAAKKKAANSVKAPMPVAVKHFTPEWEVYIPPTVRESLAIMTPEERKRWAETPMAVSHFTPYEPPKEAYQPKEVPIAIQKFTPDPNAPPKPVELDWDAMPVATRHFTPDPNIKKEYKADPVPIAVRHFTPDWEAEKAKRNAL